MNAHTQTKHRHEKLKHLQWNPSAAKEASSSSPFASKPLYCYVLLGVQQGASEAEIRSAYLQRAASAHPDKPGVYF